MAVRQAPTSSVAGLNVNVVGLAVLKLGRRHTVVDYLNPDYMMVASDVDRFSAGIRERSVQILGDVRTEITLAARPRQ